MAAAAGDFQPLPPGTYDFVIASAKAARSQNGKVQFQCRARVQGGPKNNSTALWSLTVSPENENAMAMLFRQFAALGLDQAFFATVPDGEEGPVKVAEALAGRLFTADITHRTWQGQTRENFGNVRPRIGGGVAAPVAPAGAGAPAGIPAPPAPAPAAVPPPPAPAPTPAAPAAVDPATAPPPPPPAVDPTTAPPPPPPVPAPAPSENGAPPPPF
jgi:hypothetical protein